MFVAEVPKVDCQLAQLVVPQITMSQQDTKQGEGQSALAACALLQEGGKCMSAWFSFPHVHEGSITLVTQHPDFAKLEIWIFTKTRLFFFKIIHSAVEAVAFCFCFVIKNLNQKRPHLVTTECLQVVEDLSNQSLTQLVDL